MEAVHTRGDGARIGTRTFQKLAELVERELGIRMPEGKRTMLEARLRKRLRARQVVDAESYWDLLQKDPVERTCFLDAVTTNKTDFFREPQHFALLASTIVPGFLEQGRIGRGRPLRIWSAGCSSGEEPWTLAMVLEDLRRDLPDLDYAIQATDYSLEMLTLAHRGVYRSERVQPVPEEMRRRFLLRSKDSQRPTVRIVPELRRRVRYSRLNFQTWNEPLAERQHVILCRNVMIYFDREMVDRLLALFCASLQPEGWLMVGHSESLTQAHLPLRRVQAATYRLRAAS